MHCKKKTIYPISGVLHKKLNSPHSESTLASITTYQNQICVQHVHADFPIDHHAYFLTTSYQNQFFVLLVHIHGSIDHGHFLTSTLQNQVCVLHAPLTKTNSLSCSFIFTV